MDEHKQLAGLLDGVNATSVGGPSRVLPPSPVAAVGTAGQGQVTTLFRFNPDVAAHAKPLHLGRVPEILTASVQGMGGTGPLVGIATWGSGNGSQQTCEFDIQLGFPFPFGNNPGIRAAQGGVLFSVLGTSFQLDARNDANVIPAAGLGNVAIGNAAIGPMLATASMAKGNRAGGTQLTRTLLGTYAPSGGLPATNIVAVPVPAFAKRFTVFRSPADESIQIATTDLQFTQVDGPYNVAANAVAPTLVLQPNMFSVAITNTGGAPLNVVGVVFELGL